MGLKGVNGKTEMLVNFVKIRSKKLSLVTAVSAILLEVVNVDLAVHG